MTTWRKSSYSPDSNNCVEVGWLKSSYSPDGDNCVEVGFGVGIRDSKSPAAHIPLSRSAWTSFLTATKHDALTP
ncbi:toxin [Lentzea sp. NBRC 105346]|uniref:DUF397 domain-containing protein n=1 Tax=Lentzea sp. NBRC 105346 TaxID=3032205 RepID=UPI0024A22F2F|nr:DUF397 domain-containing protein [Lentzea sp. NBRC 105346]GLZ31129.1 toxin [Lentzea sp. NBRC 105346]